MVKLKAVRDYEASWEKQQVFNLENGWQAIVEFGVYGDKVCKLTRLDDESIYWHCSNGIKDLPDFARHWVRHINKPECIGAPDQNLVDPLFEVVKAMTPKRGDKLYNVFNGQLETVRFIEESIIPGADIPTWRLRRGKETIRTSIGCYYATEREAWTNYLNRCKNDLPLAQKAITDAQMRLDGLVAEISRITTLLESNEI